MSSGEGRAAHRATRVAIAGNGLLFAVKAAAGLATGSIALVSDALNSLVDVAASVGIAYSVAVARRAPDPGHPFGHQRAEPLAALGVAIFTAILGVLVARAAVERLLQGVEPIRAPGWAVGTLLLSMIGNLVLARYLRNRGEALDSPAILANAVECENDIWASLATLAGVAGAALGAPVVDAIAGAVVGLWIIVAGYRFGRRNIDYLMGASPGPGLLEEIRAGALSVPEVRGVQDERAPHVGPRVHGGREGAGDAGMRTACAWPHSRVPAPTPGGRHRRSGRGRCVRVVSSKRWAAWRRRRWSQAKRRRAQRGHQAGGLGRRLPAHAPTPRRRRRSSRAGWAGTGRVGRCRPASRGTTRAGAAPHCAP